MDKNERLALSRQRSTGAVIADGYQLFSTISGQSSSAHGCWLHVVCKN